MKDKNLDLKKEAEAFTLLMLTGEAGIEDEMKFYHKQQLGGNMPNPWIFRMFDGIMMRTESNTMGLISFSIPKDAQDYCYIRQLYVPVENRKCGVGKKIINKLEELIKSQGTKSIELESEEASLDFFLKIGYKLTGQPNNRMQKKL